MKKLILFLALIYCNFQQTFAQAGKPDPSFGNNGIVKTGIGSIYDYTLNGQKVLVQTDGSIYIIFYTNGQTIISKKQANGSADMVDKGECL